MKINKIAASWNQAEVSLGAGPRRHRGPQPANFRPLESLKSHEQKFSRAAALIFLHFVVFFVGVISANWSMLRTQFSRFVARGI
jgi:uncharacterized membrane protein (DUF485 family)